jgi:4-amino-4-deoxy-L-arabinose transferase-like glycosyltransferase
MKTEAPYRRSMIDTRRSRLAATARHLSSAIALNWPLLVIVGLGIVLRLWLISISALDARFSDADDGDYYQRALRLAVTGQYLDDSWLIRPPLHVLFFALWLRLGILLGRPALGITLIELAQTAIAALTIVLGHAITRRLFGNARAGLLFAAFLALWFSFVEQPSVLFSELLYLFLFLLHFWLLLRFDANERPRDLALAGLALGASALTRSPALYSLAFVVLWLVVRPWRTKNKEQRTTGRLSNDRSLFFVLSSLFLVTACCLAVVLPWTARNYVVYGRFIPVDTLGQTNLWLDLDADDLRNEKIATLRKLPQADRAEYAMARAREILAADPARPFRQMWDTFRHVWKMQFVEDYFVKRSFFSRPLRAAAPLGLAGDVMWLVFTIGGLFGLAAPPREGWHNRLFMLAWLGYSLVTVLVFHVEPRYLLPIWTLLGIYGAWALAYTTARTGRHGAGMRLLGRFSAYLRAYPHSTALGAGLTITFLILLLTYRDYPRIIASGIARERAMIAGERAYAADDYPAAESGFRAALAAQPTFVDAKVGLALALAAQGRREEAMTLIQGGGSRMADFVAGALNRDTGNPAAAIEPMQSSELNAGEDIQRWAIEWLRPPATNTLTLGNGLDLGYLSGFSGAEANAGGGFRWLAGDGRVVLPLAEPLRADAAIVLRMTSGRQEVVPLDVWVGGRWSGRVLVAGGSWRTYRLMVPPELAGQRRVDIRLSAPTFVPARLNPASDDARTLSLMIGQVRVE